MSTPSPASPKLPPLLHRVHQVLRQSQQQGGLRSPTESGDSPLATLEARLSQGVLRVAVFGLVSRGKSAVINALLGEPLLATGPLHGVTRWPRSVYWRPPVEAVHDPQDLLQVELIDTPGLDEIDGEGRGAMAQEVAEQADLILFVVAGDITRTEYEAMEALQVARKPLVLVFNKIDLYPDTDRQAIRAALKALWQQRHPQATQSTLVVDDIVMVAAAPAPVPVQVEWPDGRSGVEWETPAPEIGPLRQVLIQLVRQDGAALIGLNVLRQADGVAQAGVQARLSQQAEAAEALIWQFAKYKALAVAFNPVMVLDVLGGIMADLALIRALAKLYGLPITNHETRRLWWAIAKSSGGLILGEVGTGLLMGGGKTAAAAWGAIDGVGGFSALVATMTAQAGAAGYGTYAVGKAAQVYLAQGCTWGPAGIKTAMADILATVDQDSTVARLSREIAAELGSRGTG